MKHELGWYFPDGEAHFQKWMRGMQQMRDGLLQYQLTKYYTAMYFVKRRGVAVDVGAHIGQWSRNMAKDFGRIFAFEPVPQYAECWQKNMEGVQNAMLYLVALGDKAGVVSMRAGTPGALGDTFVATREEANAANDVELRTLDSYALPAIDFLKVDCEGYEMFVLRGGEKTIQASKPCIIVEQKPGHAAKYGLGQTDAVALLEGWGAKVRTEMGGDFILSW
jgi:FkbM family methyltransferase